MSILLLETLRKAELEQYYSSFSSNGITQLETLAQLSMQDYSSLGITSIPDRKKLFQLVQSLRQEIPTLENGLVSSPTKYRLNKSPPSSSNASISSSPGIFPDLSGLSVANLARRSSGQTANMPPALPQIPTRSRSRTLPTSDNPNHLSPYHQNSLRPELLKTSNSSNNLFLNEDNSMLSDGEDSDSSQKCEIRRGSGPLLDPYGVPIQNKIRYNSMRHQSNTASPSSNSSPSQQFQQAIGQSDLNQKIRVCVRKRPLSKKEVERGEKDITPTAGVRSINVNEPKMKLDLTKYIEQHSFTFDDVFDTDESNEKIYQRTAQPLVKYVFEGGKATCFAYGQTGSGKTYTMLDPKLGLYVLAARDVFSLIRQPQYEHLSAWIGFYEIYQGQLYDLLNNRKKLFAREDGKQNVVIVGLKEFVIKNVEDLMQVFEYGSQSRSTGSTGANSDSSRSHAVLQILLRPTKNRKKIIGKLSFIDLAGSERGADRGETDIKTRMEGAEINKSLLALKECIRALDQDKRHTPFRQSKLTQVLKDSFVGNSRTCMIATVSPNQSNSEHTLNTLRYADRVKELKGERDRRVLSSSTDNSNNTINNTMNNNNNSNSMDESNLVHQRQLSSSEEYPNEDEYPNDYGESDDAELYNDVEDDDFLLHDEDFPTDGDVNILDKDFLHENNNRESQDQLTMQQQRRSYEPPPVSSRMIPSSDNNKFKHPLDMATISSSPDYVYEQKIPKQDEPTPVEPSPPQLEECLFFDPNTIESFIKFHRAQIREVTEYSKKETKLLANFSLGLSSRRNDDEQQPPSIREELKTSSEFIGYLDNLDEVLEMKTAAIEALRDRIRHVLGEEEL
ncbi:P-loop containing nucleoside triphosphate hydrolase protein [Gilbertella persicaria]|uniref:P-loop containing nucleoside triphosphate hydrolase protein n=1 Tax=Gilbertella persicaria TaxID=101096 RepID=UPI00221FEC9D|nr:P-loop containing nucleoside triphosphate hydrolase protein [Gilbertella persicaria]KAI8054927.1 P-loop containing nucleoside triphosphate hydrolase protein [Gilbertella persicaria]